MFLAEFDELRRRNNWEKNASDESVNFSAEHLLGPKPKDDRIRLRLPRASIPLTVKLEPDLIEVHASENAAYQLGDALKNAVAQQRAERTMKSLEEIP
jgi:hypothetical protein